MIFEEKSWLECEFKPFCRTKHKCLRCMECDFQQYKWCLENSEKTKEMGE